jgi:hypothetical protein
MQINAHKFWQQSQMYIAGARKHLNPLVLKPESIVGPHDEDEWLRIAFLFPTLPEKSKTDLLVVRRFYLIAREQQERERVDPNESAEYSEAMADQVAGQLKEALPSFSPVQREILEHHYLMFS